MNKALAVVVLVVCSGIVLVRLYDAGIGALHLVGVL